MPFTRDTPYNELPPLPPIDELETKAVLKAVVSAGRALAELKVKCTQIPNPSILIDNLMSLEAKDSSEIENIFTTHDKLFQATVLEEGSVDVNTKEVVRYRQAIFKGLEEARQRPLSSNTFISIMQTIKRTDATIRKTPGTRIVNPAGEIIYTPPEGEALIRSLLANLDEFINKKSDLDPLVKMAIAHYQFEAIHPFGDGNGRTGRIINILYLVQCELINHPILFLSRYIIENKKDYYLCLQGITERGEWEKWLLYMLAAVEHTALWTIKIIDQIFEAMAITQAIMRGTTKFYSKDLLEAIFRHPFCRYQALIDAGITTNRLTASKYLKALSASDVGLLEEMKFGREVVFFNRRLFEILTNPSI